MKDYCKFEDRFQNKADSQLHVQKLQKKNPHNQKMPGFEIKIVKFDFKQFSYLIFSPYSSSKLFRMNIKMFQLSKKNSIFQSKFFA
jgi:hypothetical protein